MTTDEQFARFWNAYPRRVGRKKAREAFEKALRVTTLDTMLSALEWQVKQPQWLKEDGAFIIFPQGWLNQERWDDEPPVDLRAKQRREGAIELQRFKDEAAARWRA